MSSLKKSFLDLIWWELFFFSSLIGYVKTYRTKTKQEKAQQLILSNAASLSPNFVRRLLPKLLPDLNDTAIFEESIECFVCYSELDFSADQILFLTCCDGGSFACSSCVGTHSTRFKHETKGERGIVRQTAFLRRAFL